MRIAFHLRGTWPLCYILQGVHVLQIEKTTIYRKPLSLERTVICKMNIIKLNLED